MIKVYKYLGLAAAVVLILSAGLTGCKIPELATRSTNTTLPETFQQGGDSSNIANLTWREFFGDPYLQALIDTALKNNQELNIVLQEIEMSRNDIRIRKGEYLPFVNIGAAAGVDKVARYTNIGAMEATTDIKPGKEMPEPLTDLALGVNAEWELDIWHKLHNAKKAAVKRYLSSIEGKHFVMTHLIAEIASAYYELLALDNELAIVKRNIGIQADALEIVKLQKEATRVTELAVQKFEAEVLKTRSLQFEIEQEIIETENKINFLLARYPQRVSRPSQAFEAWVPGTVAAGVPAQLLSHRPDVRQAEQDLDAAKLDVSVARAQFYPSIKLSASVGYRAFNPAYFLKTPESLLYSLAGDLIAPLVNKNAIKAEYSNANARQLQAVFRYERTVLNACTEVINQLAGIHNLQSSFDLRSKQVEALTRSIDISNDLFKSARADYMEVLLTQRDALESKFELTEIKKQQMLSYVGLYHALGGGWQ
ncbi:TolC family protein [Niabella insulamsoli]|uniref:TolC family protein n=1 Tax=Niabella insulamsoli TaxID=3144874 RepID=UPI0031FD98B5